MRGITDLVAAQGERLLAVAVDVLGGYFAINGGDLPGELGEVAYWGPDTLDWTPLGLGHGAFVREMLGGAVVRFYEQMRWVGWEEEVADLALDHGLSVYPFPFTKEGQDLSRTSRRAVPLSELLGLFADMARQLDDAPDGQFRATISE